MQSGKYKKVRDAAAKMVAWYSQQFTTGQNPYAADLERKGKPGTYPYRLRIQLIDATDW